MVDDEVLKTSAVRRGGSSPSTRTMLILDYREQPLYTQKPQNHTTCPTCEAKPCLTVRTQKLRIPTNYGANKLRLLGEVYTCSNGHKWRIRRAY